MKMFNVVCAVLFGCVSFAASGCASEDATTPTPEEGAVASVSSELGVCPTTTALKIDRQRRASDLLAYILGNDEKTPADPFLTYYANNIRREIWYGSLVPSRGVSKTACGLPATYVRFDCAADRIGFCPRESFTEFYRLAETAELITPGIGPFMHVEAGTGNAVYVEFDPEPAVLTSSLSGGTGSSASALFATSRVSTSVRKWNNTWTSCTSNCPTGGQPCSASTLSAGTNASSEIQKSGSSYKCL